MLQGEGLGVLIGVIVLLHVAEQPVGSLAR